MATTPIISPDGAVADVPNEHVPALVAKGGKVGVDMLAPTGERAVVPVEQVKGLMQRGAKVIGAPAGTPPPVPAALQQKMPQDVTPEQYQAMTPAQQKAWDSQVRNARISDLPSDIANEAVGAGKGVLNTLYHTGEIATKYLDPKTYAQIQATQAANPQMAEQNKGLITPDEGQKAGFYGEQGAEFLAPDAVVGDVAKATKALPLAARIAARAGLSGAGATAVSAMHGDENPLLTGAVGAAGGAASEALDAAAPWIQEHAESLYNKALSPSTKINKNLTAKVVPELIDQGEWGSLKSLSNRAEDVKSEVGPQIDGALQAKGNIPQSIKPVMDTLDDFKSAYVSSNGTVLNSNAVDAVEKLQGQLTDMANGGTMVPTKDLVAMRRVLDSQVARAGGYAGQTLADGSTVDAMREGANSIRAELAKANPDLNTLNQKYSLWSNVQKIADATIQRRTGQVGGLLGNGVAETAGALAGELAGAPIKGGLSGMALRAAQKTVTSPTVRTARAVAWGKLGAAIENGQFTAASKIARSLATAGASAVQDKE